MPTRKNWFQSLTLLLTIAFSYVITFFINAYAGSTVYIHPIELIQDLGVLIISIINLALPFLILCYAYNILWNNTTQKLKLDRKCLIYGFYSLAIAYLIYFLITIFDDYFEKTQFLGIYSILFVVFAACAYRILDKLDLPI